jgi:hypothetical protein
MLLFPVICVVYLTTKAPAPLTDELTLAGFLVWEALAISEVLSLCETEAVDAVIIAADVVSPVVDILQKHVTLRLQPEATARDVVWELSNLFPGASSVQ